ncbi:mitochondrial import receptor subunit TOM6 homolog [Osmerus mordax]|uniref:mitochondrial import receptor subunit TOM6 homolog n=1 Tax=Osmerus mordax TaxID=8014 RepID=UPI00350F9620
MLKQKATEDRTQAFKMSGAGKKGAVGPSGVVEWIRSACHFATDRNDFRRNLLVNLGIFAAGVWVARNLSDFDLMSPQPVT